jgi:hypothetical protein
LAQPGHPAVQHPRNALKGRGNARGVAREQDAPAHRGIGGQRVVVVVGGDQHVRVLSTLQELGEKVAEVHFRSPHLSGAERDQVHSDAHVISQGSPIHGG